MKITCITQTVKDIACDALVVGVAYKKAGQQKKPVFSSVAQQVDSLLEGLLQEIYADGEFKGEVGELNTIHTFGKLAAKRVIVVGLGSVDKLHTRAIRRAVATAARHAQQTGAQTLALACTLENSEINKEEQVQAETEGALLGLYTFRKYQSSHLNGNGKHVQAVSLLVEDERDPAVQAAMHKGITMAEATNFARDLVNEPPNVLSPAELASRAVTVAKHFGLEYEVLEREQMQELGMGGLLAVSSGSAQPPKLAILRYRGAPAESKEHIALVGKGITFDTGGISLKPAERMHEMKGDMAGAAAVIGAMQVIGALRPAINVTALIPTTENMPDGSSYRPGDILRIMNGKTIEIVNTDAEGRLALADALSYAVKEGCSPIIDIATLTGACVVALGAKRAGLFSNDDTLRDEILSAGEEEGEKFWPL